MGRTRFPGEDQVRQRRSSEQQGAGQQMEVQETRPMRHGFQRTGARLWRGGRRALPNPQHAHRRE